MNQENIDDSSMQAKDIESIWHGDETIDETDGDAATDETDGDGGQPRPRLSERLDKPISRRDLFRGAPFRQDEAS